MLGFIILDRIASWAEKEERLTVGEVLKYSTMTKSSSGVARYLLSKQKLAPLLYCSPNKNPFDDYSTHEFGGFICRPGGVLECTDINVARKISSNVLASVILFIFVVA